MNHKDLLEIAIKTYEMEKHREETLNTKAGAIIAADIAVIVAVIESTLSSGKVFLPPVKSAITGRDVYVYTICIVALLFLFYGMIKLYRAFQMSDYGAIDIDTLIQRSANADEESTSWIFVGIKHINEIIKVDRNTNNRKAGNITSGFKSSLLGIGMLIIYIVANTIL